MNYIYLLLLLFVTINSIIIPIDQLEIKFYKESNYTLKRTQTIIDSKNNILGIIDDENQNYFNFEFYDVIVEDSRKKVAQLLFEFWEKCQMAPLRIQGQFTQIDFNLRKPKNADIILNQYKNNIWSLFIYPKDNTDILEIKFRIPENHDNDEFIKQRILIS